MLSYYLGLSNNNTTDDIGYEDKCVDNKNNQGLIVGIAKGIELCDPQLDFDAYDEDIAKMFGVL